MTTPKSSKILGLDVGNKRVGVATASLITKLPQPLTTLENNKQIFAKLQDIISQEDVGLIVVGLPRNLSGQETDQTKQAQKFGDNLKAELGLPIMWQDEALTSKQAENELNNRGVSYNKAQIDALAATYILNDYLLEHPEDNS